MRGGLASQLLGIEVISEPGFGGLEFEDLAGIGIRRNPKRAHLLVSRVLGKHIATPGQVAVSSGEDLASAVRQHIGGERGEAKGRGASPPPVGSSLHQPPACLVVGFAETACALGEIVAASIPDAALAQTTRFLAAGESPWLRVRESHSHAPDHFLLDGVRLELERCQLVILVDDELSTGMTAWNLIESLNAAVPGREYIVACLIDARPPSIRELFASEAARLHVNVAVVSLLDAEVRVPAGAAAAVRDLIADGGGRDHVPVVHAQEVVSLELPTVCLPDPRHGVSHAARAKGAANLRSAVGEVVGSRLSGRRVLVLGIEEDMHSAILVAAFLGADVQSTSRSPALTIDHPEYPLRTGVTLRSAFSSDPAYLYNGPSKNISGVRYDEVLLISTSPGQMGSAPARLPSDLLAAAGACCTGTVWTAQLLRQRDPDSGQI